MGGGSSRTITLEEERDGAITISENVLKLMIQSSQVQDEHGNMTDFSQQDEQHTHSDRVWQERLRQIEDHWSERLRKAEEKNANLAQITSEQFNQAADKVEAKFMKDKYVCICENLQQAVLDCYQANPKQVLKCSDEVKAFNACVQQTQNSILTGKGMPLSS
ncbi:uncharacterized protein [Antedon mediterranea]|uniref:uncharacterized protein n=1 Tax=Antedon mediterranea TaxID=105859 RepID=UPI003AF603EF